MNFTDEQITKVEAVAWAEPQCRFERRWRFSPFKKHVPAKTLGELIDIFQANGTPILEIDALNGRIKVAHTVEER